MPLSQPDHRGSPMPNAVRQTAEDDVRGEGTHGPVDPKPDPVAVSTNRITQLVTTIDEETRKDWGTTRDVMDDMLRAFEEEGEAIKRSVSDYAEKSVALIDTSRVIRDAVDRGRKELAHRKHATVTALPQRQPARQD
jgi:hypothetical protein